MLPAFLTTIFFSLSVIFATRSALLLGGPLANLGRMVVAVLLLAGWAFTFGSGASGPGLFWFFVSGVIGFGFGDIALFLALPRIGPRLTILLIQCLAAPFGALAERVWLGVSPTGSQLLCGAIILAGVALSLAPQRGLPAPAARASGIVFGVIAALGQGLGAVVSRKGFVTAEMSGVHVDGGTAAFQRMLGGIIVTALFYVAARVALRRAEPSPRPPRIAWLWMLLNGISGPAIGVGCYQWALAGTPSGIVLPIVATTPVVTIPLAYWMEGDKPGARSVIGGLIAVAGCVGLALT